MEIDLNIMVEGLSSLHGRRRALQTTNVAFPWSHAAGFHIFTFPSLFISVNLRKKKQKRRLIFGVLENRV